MQAPELDFGQFERCARARPVQAKKTGRGISSRSRLGRDRKENDATHILRLKPLMNRFKIGQSQAKECQKRELCDHGELNAQANWNFFSGSDSVHLGRLRRRH
jgi:hypothetical protein